METKHTPNQQVGHVGQDWLEIWGPDDAEGSHEILGHARGPDREANAVLWAAAPIGYALADAVLCQIEDGMDRAECIRKMAIDFMMQADPDRLKGDFVLDAALEPKQ